MYANGMNNRISMSVLGLREWAETGNRAEREERETRARRNGDGDRGADTESHLHKPSGFCVHRRPEYDDEACLI